MKKYVLFAIIFVVALLAIPTNAQLYTQFGRPGEIQVTVGIGGGYGYPNNYFGNYGYGNRHNAAAYAQCVNRGFWICQYYEGYPFYGDSIFYQSRWISRIEYMNMMQQMRQRQMMRNRRDHHSYDYGRR